MRQLRLRMSDETVRSVTVDENQPVANLMVLVCTQLGITNHDEYSLIATGKHTINGRRKDAAKVEGRIIDAKMEQLKKKLKTDEDLAWLDHSKTLDEQGVNQDDIVLLRRKFFYSDLNVDSRDPVQLGLLYVQTRDAILGGTHPVTVDGACKFAGLQAQAQLGDFVESKTTRPGYMSLRDFLPADYAKQRHIERKVFAEHRKHYGLNELDAKSRYVSEARSLPTYGVTFFLVKEKVAGKNKLVPRLLGVTRDCVMRVDADTKGILKTWPLTTVKRWAASVNSFTLDFGDYADAYYSVQTTEGEQISALIAGYIDIILKRKKAKDHFGIEGDEGATMIEDSVAPSRATIIQNVPTLQRPPPPPEPEQLELASVAGPQVQKSLHEQGPIIEPAHFGPAFEVRGKAEVGFESKPLTQYVTNYELTVPQRDLQTRLEHAQDAVEEAQKVLDRQQTVTTTSTVYQQHQHQSQAHKNQELDERKRKLSSQFADINAATAQLVSLSAIPEDELDYPELNSAVETVAQALPEVARDVKAVAALLDDERCSEQLIDAARRLCKAFSDLLNAAEPGPTVPRQSLISAASRVGDATQALLYAIGGNESSSSSAGNTLGAASVGLTGSSANLNGNDESSDTLLALAKSVANAAAALVLKAKDVAATCNDDDELQNSVIGSATQCALATSQMVATAKIVAPTVRDAGCQRKLLDACHEVGRAVDGIQASCARALRDPTLLGSVQETVLRVNAALDELVAHVRNLRRAQNNQQSAQNKQQHKTTTTTTTEHTVRVLEPEHDANFATYDESYDDQFNSSKQQNDDDDDADERAARAELVSQARSLAQATTQLIQDIHRPDQHPHQHQQQYQLDPNRHSVYESESQYSSYKQRKQPQALPQNDSWQDAAARQQNHTTVTTHTTTTNVHNDRDAPSYYEQQQQLLREQQQRREQQELQQQQLQQQLDRDYTQQQQHHNQQTTTTTVTTTVQDNVDNDSSGDHHQAISGLIGDLDTTILYATAGTLRASPGDARDTYGYHRERILRTAKALVEDTKRLVTSAAGDERQLAEAARESVATIGKLAEAVKAGAASLGANQAEAQVNLIRSVKDVASSLSGLIGSTKAAHGQDASDPSMLQVKDSAKDMVTSVSSLLRTVKSVEDEQERGVRAIETAIETIDNELSAHDVQCQRREAPEARATRARPDELIRASKPLTLATAKTVAAGSSGIHDDAIVAANMGRKAVADLLATTRSASFNTNDHELRARVHDSGRQCGQSYKALLELLHTTLQHPAAAAQNPEMKLELIGQSRALAGNVAEVVNCCELLKASENYHQVSGANSQQQSNNNNNNNGQPWLDPTDPGAIAETELLGAASSIDAAAKKLENLKPRITSVKLPHEELNFDEMILDAAKCIIEATAALLRAASASQRELIVDGRLDETEIFYAPDHNQWSEGLVSAARMVAAATHSLVEAANALVQGQASEERLISAAKQVASSTNQLLVACKVKADPDSKTMNRLQNAGNAVKRATDNLVRASQQAIEHDEEQSLIISNRKVSGIAQEISAREQILRKEKELQVAKTQLMAIRKAKYSNRPDDYQGYGGALD